MGLLALLVPGSPGSQARPSAVDRAERKPRLAPDQNPRCGRFSIPQAGRSTQRAAYPRYRLNGGQDSNAEDFCATYRIEGPGRTGVTIPREPADGLGAEVPAHADVAFTDRDGGVRREVYVVYAGPGGPGGAGGPGDGKERFGEAHRTSCRSCRSRRPGAGAVVQALKRPDSSPRWGGPTRPGDQLLRDARSEDGLAAGRGVDGVHELLAGGVGGRVHVLARTP